MPMPPTFARFFAFLGLLCLIPAPAALAQRIVGSGGDILICAGQNHLLDFYVGRTYLGLTPRAGEVHGLAYDDTTPDFQEIAPLLPVVEFWLSRLDRLDRARADLYREYLQAFPREWSLVDDQEFRDMPDEGQVDVPDDCEAHQVAVQRQPATSLERRYMVSLAMWRRLDPLDRAGLILHEIVYREGLTRGHDDSYYVRQLTALLADAEAVDRLDAAAYLKRIRDLFFTAIREAQPGIFAQDTQWVYYQELVDSAPTADRLCRERLGGEAFGGFAAFGSHQLSHNTDSVIVRQVHKQRHPLFFWNVNSRGEAERWSFDGWYTRQAADSTGPTELLCSYLR
jgi:hypothetical protein